jgi:hypothetical protein
MSGRTSRSQDGDVDNMMNEILEALELIKAKMPNGEMKVIQEKISGIESSQEDMHEDLRLIKKQLLDPEDGIVVRVNKNTEFRKKKEEAERDYSKIIDEHKELMSWKTTVTKFLWIIISSIAGIIVAMLFGNTAK